MSADRASPYAEPNAQLTSGCACSVGCHQVIDFSWTELTSGLVARWHWQLVADCPARSEPAQGVVSPGERGLKDLDDPHDLWLTLLAC